MSALGALSDALTRTGGFVEDNKATMAVVGGVAAVSALTWYFSRAKGAYRKKPSNFEIGSGGVDKGQVVAEVRDAAQRGVPAPAPTPEKPHRQSRTEEGAPSPRNQPPRTCPPALPPPAGRRVRGDLRPHPAWRPLPPHAGGQLLQGV